MSQTINVGYQFVPVPLNLFNCLDNNCRSVLFALIQLSSYYAKEDSDGWFYRSNSDLQAQTNLSKNVLSAALDALYINKIIDIQCAKKGQGVKQIGRKYKVLFESFRRFERISIEDSIKDPECKIETCDYKKCSIPSFQRNSEQTSTLTSSQTSLPTSRKSDNNIDNRDNIKNKENIGLIYNKLIIEKDRIIEEGLNRFDYQLYSDSSMSFLDDHEKELFNSFKYFNSDEFDGEQKFLELVACDSSIGYEEIEQLFKYCIRKQAVQTSTEEVLSESSAPDSPHIQSEDEFISALIGKMNKMIAAPQQECGDYTELVDDCIVFYGWGQERARKFIEELKESIKRIA